MKKILFTLVVFLMTFTVSLATSNPKEKITETYENGSVKQKVFVYEAYYKFVSYFIDGTIEEVGYYDSNGEKNGNWVRYNEKGIVIAEASEIEERLNRKGSIVELQKHANLGDGVEAITVKIYFNAI